MPELYTPDRILTRSRAKAVDDIFMAAQKANAEVGEVQDAQGFWIVFRRGPAVVVMSQTAPAELYISRADFLAAYGLTAE